MKISLLLFLLVGFLWPCNGTHVQRHTAACPVVSVGPGASAASAASDVDADSLTISLDRWFLHLFSPHY